MQLPNTRNHGIVINDLSGELLVYDLVINKAYCLNETSAIIFNACGEQQSFEDLKHQHQFTDDLIHLALDELKKQNLIEDDYVSPLAGMNRRDVIKKVGLASMIVLPIISSIIAPSAANAASGTNCSPVQTCIQAGQNLCGGSRAGTTFVRTAYFSTNGSCSGSPAGAFSTNQTIDCNTYNNNVSSSYDSCVS